MSKHREPKTGSNPKHGNNTLLVKVPETFTLGSGSKGGNGQRCGDCTGFHFCVAVKGVKEATNYCQWASNLWSNGNILNRI